MTVDDITGWPVEKLRELAIWHAEVEGIELTDQPDEIPLLTDPAADHGINTDNEMLATGDELKLGVSQTSGGALNASALIAVRLVAWA